MSMVAGLLVGLGSVVISLVLPEISLAPTGVELLLTLGLVMLFFGVDLREASVITIIAWIGALILRFVSIFILGIAVGIARIIAL
jgi:hypothetical protein